jgi:hypothetical protein
MKNWPSESLACILHDHIPMHIVYQAAGSRMQGRIHENGQFFLYLSAASLTPELTLSGSEVTRILAHHVMRAHLVRDTITQIETLPEKHHGPRLRGQHKALRGR